MHKKSIHIYGLLVVANAIVIGQMMAPSIRSGIYFLNVSQGDAQLIAYKDARILIDVGKNTQAGDELERILGNKKYIDIVMLTHPDTDHMQGIYNIIERYDIGVLLLGGVYNQAGWTDMVSYAVRANVPVYGFSVQNSIRYKDARLEVLWPDPFYITKQDNERSLVIKYENDEYSALFTGDITEKTETIFKNAGMDLDVDILKVAHHGSKYSSSPEFLRAVSPILSIIEVGKNSYGHPTQETLDRLYASGSAMLRTDEQGTMRVYKKDGAIAAQRIE